MRAAVFHGPGNVRVETVADAALEQDTDVLVRVCAAALCGRDLWAWRGYGGQIGRRTGHEFVGVVEEIGSQVRGVHPGDLVLAPPGWSDGSCEYCLAGLTSSCVDGGTWGSSGHDGAHGEAVRVPQAEATLLRVPDELAGDLATLLALSCAVPAAHHAAVSAGVGWDATVVVVGDGAVGLAAVRTARRLGAGRIVVVGHHDDRLELAGALGADGVVNAGGGLGPGVEEAMSRTGGAQCVLECVGAQSSWATAVALTRDGGRIGHVGTPHPADRIELHQLFERNITLGGGVAPARAYLPGLLRDAANGHLDVAPLVDLVLPLEEIADAYTSVDERIATKVRLTI